MTLDEDIKQNNTKLRTKVFAWFLMKCDHSQYFTPCLRKIYLGTVTVILFPSSVGLKIDLSFKVFITDRISYKNKQKLLNNNDLIHTNSIMTHNTLHLVMKQDPKYTCHLYFEWWLHFQEMLYVFQTLFWYCRKMLKI